MLDKTIKVAYSVDAAIPNSDKIHSLITDKHQVYTDLKHGRTNIWKLNALLQNRYTFSNKLHDLSPRIPVVTPLSLLAIFPVLKENTLSACMVTAVRTSTAAGIPAKKVHWLAGMTCDLGWSLSQ